jgi:hypothetical protein
MASSPALRAATWRISNPWSSCSWCSSRSCSTTMPTGRRSPPRCGHACRGAQGLLSAHLESRLLVGCSLSADIRHRRHSWFCWQAAAASQPAGRRCRSAAVRLPSVPPFPPRVSPSTHCKHGQQEQQELCGQLTSHPAQRCPSYQSSNHSAFPVQGCRQLCWRQRGHADQRRQPSPQFGPAARELLGIGSGWQA